MDDDVSVRDLVPENVGNTLDDDLNVNEPVIAGKMMMQSNEI